MGVAEGQEGGGEVKALSVRQPWASLIIAGLKPVENRTRPTKYRGSLLVHASLGPLRGGPWAERCGNKCQGQCDDHVCHALDWLDEQGCGYPVGAVIGQVDLVDCVQGHPSPWAAPGAWHWVLANPKKFDAPVPYPGRLGLFDAPDPDPEHLFKPHDGTTRRVCLREETCDVVITRPGFWGNPFKVVRVNEPQHGVMAPGGWGISRKGSGLVGLAGGAEKALASCIDSFEAYARADRKLMLNLPMLKGKRLGCFCAPGEACHGDVLVKLVGEVCGG